MKHDIQFIEKGGQPEWAIIPYEDYQKLMQIYNYFDDDALLERALTQNINDEKFPHHVVTKLVHGENPLRVFRQYRGKTMNELAKHIGVTQSYLSQLESSNKQASQKVLKALAEYLNVDIEDLVE